MKDGQIVILAVIAGLFVGIILGELWGVFGRVIGGMGGASISFYLIRKVSKHLNY